MDEKTIIQYEELELIGRFDLIGECEIDREAFEKIKEEHDE